MEQRVSSLVWHDCETDPPDEGKTVLLYAEDPQASEPVWPAFKEDGQWFWAEGSEAHKPKLWTDVPHPHGES